MKKGALLIASGLLLLLAAALVAPTFIDWNRYRADIAERLAAATGRNISLGSISFRVLPRPTLRAHGVTIANIAEATSPYFARIGSLNVQVALFPLLTGNLKVQNIVLSEPHVVFEILSDGRANWRFGDAPGTQAGTTGTSVPIDRLDLADGFIEYRNAQTGEDISVKDVNATLEAETLAGPYDLEGTARYQEVPVRVDASLGAWRDDGAPVPIKISLDLTETDASAGFSGTMTAPLSQPDVAGTLTAEGGNFHRAGIAASRMMAFDVPALPTAAFRFQSELSVTSESVRLDRMTVRVGEEEVEGRVTVERGEPRAMEITLSANRLNLDALLNAMPTAAAASAQPAEASSPPTLPADLGATVDLSINAADFRGGIVRQIHLRATLEDGTLNAERLAALLPGGSDVLFTGVLTTPESGPSFDGRLKIASGSLRGFLAWAGVDASAVPADRLAQFTCRSDLALRPDAIRFSDLDLMLDSTHARGSLALDTGEDRSITADLNIDRLAIDAYLPTAEGGEGFSLNALDGLAADLSLDIDRLSYEDTLLAGVATRTIIEDGTLRLDSLRIEQWGGATVTAKGAVSDLPAKPRAAFEFTADGPSFDRFLAATGTTLPAILGPMRQFTLAGGVEGTTEAVDLRLTGAIGESTVDLSGRAEQLGTVPTVVLNWEVENASLASFIRQTGLPLDPPSPGDDTAVAVKGQVKGGLDRLSGKTSVATAGGTLNLAGQYGGKANGNRFDLELTGQQKDPVAFVRALGFDYKPAGPLGPASLALSASGGSDTVAMELSRLAIGEMTLEGTARLDRAAKPAMLTATLDASILDLDALLPPTETGLDQAEAAKMDSVAAKSQARWSREPIDWSALTALNADIRLTADAIRRSQYRFVEPTAQVRIENGAFRLDPLAGQLFGGTVDLQVVARSGAVPDVDLSLSLKNASVEEALMATTGNRSATGVLNLDGTFAAAGKSQYAMIQSLDGRAAMTAESGVIRKIDLPRLSQRLNALERIEDFLSLAQGALSGGETPYRRMAGTLDVTKGVGRTRDTRADIEAAEANLDATIDLPNWQLDATGQFRLTEHPQAPPIRVHLTGPIDSPHRDVQIRALQAYFANKLGAALLKRALGQEEEGVGGLFGDEPNEQSSQTQEAPSRESEPLNPIDLLFEQLRKRREPAQ